MSTLPLVDIRHWRTTIVVDHGNVALQIYPRPAQLTPLFETRNTVCDAHAAGVPPSDQMVSVAATNSTLNASHQTSTVQSPEVSGSARSYV